MKKTKLLVPLLGITATAGAIVPLAVSCNKKAATYTVKAVDCEGIETITDKEVDNEGEYSVEVKPLANYTLDGTITVKVGDKDAEASYYNYVPANSGSYKLTIAKVTGNTTFTIKGVAAKKIGTIQVGWHDDWKPTETDVELQANITEITDQIKVGDKVDLTITTTDTSIGKYALLVPPSILTEDLIDENAVYIQPAGDGAEKVHLTYGVDYDFENIAFNHIAFKVAKTDKFLSQTGEFKLCFNLGVETSSLKLTPILDNGVITQEDIKLEYKIGSDADYTDYTGALETNEIARLVNDEKIEIKISPLNSTNYYLLPYSTITGAVVETNFIYLFEDRDFTLDRNHDEGSLTYKFASGSVLDDIYIHILAYKKQ